MRHASTVMAVSLACVISICTCGCVVKQSSASAKIGIPAPLSGGSAEYGFYIKEGATLASNEINAQGGIDGRKLELIFEDSQGLPAQATNAAERLIARDHVNVITDAFNSSATLAAVGVAERERVPMVVGLSTADSITASGSPFVFRVCLPNTDLARLLGTYITEREKPARVAFIYEKTDFGTNLANVVRKQLEASGAETVDFEGVNQHQADFLSLITKLKNVQPDTVFLAVIGDSGLPFLRQARQAGFRARWANAVSLSNPGFLQEAGQAANGFIGITHFDAELATGQAAAFVKEFKAAYGVVPTHYSAVYYDDIFVIAAAMRRGGMSPTGIADALKQTDFRGITGRIKFDARGQAHIGTVIFRWTGERKEILQVNPGS